MRRAMVLLVVLAAGCADAPEGREPAVVGDIGGDGDGELVVLHLPAMGWEGVPLPCEAT